MARKKDNLKPRGHIVVVEAGGDRLKMVAASAARGGLRIDRVHTQRIDDGQSVADAIAAAIRKHKFNPRRIVGVLPRSAVSIRLLELPSTDAGEIADMVDIQVARQTPYSRDEVMAGHRTLSLTRRGTYSRILLAIVQRGTVRERFHDLEKGGLDVERLAIASEGMLAWARRCDGTSDAAIAVLDMDAACSDLTVIRDGNVLFSKQMMTGADGLRAAAASNHEAYVSDIARTLAAGSEASPGLDIAKLLVAGAGASVDGLLDVLKRDLPMPVEAAPQVPSGVTDPSGACAQAAKDGFSLVPLIGIAIAPDALTISMIPEVVRMRRQLASSGRSYTRLAALIMATLVAGSLWLSLAYQFRAQRAEAMRAEVAATVPRTRRIERQIEVIREVRRRQDPRFTPLNLLPAIHACVPPDVYFGTIDIDAARRAVRLSGTAPSRRDVRTLIANLETSPLFDDARESGRSVEDRSGRFVFEVACSLKEIR